MITCLEPVLQQPAPVFMAFSPLTFLAESLFFIMKADGGRQDGEWGLTFRGRLNGPVLRQGTSSVFPC